MRMPYLINTRLVLACCLPLLVSQVHAAINIAGTLTDTDPTTSSRLLRDGVVSTCAAPKGFPGTFGTGPFAYDTHTAYNPGASQCVTVNVDVDTCGTNVFVAAYLGSVDPTNLATNYLADQGSSVTGAFRFIAPANSAIAFLVTSTSSVPTSCSYTITSTELMPTQAASLPVQAVPTLTEWTLLLLSTLLAGVAFRRVQRR